jgi:type IV pilus assembly protein PilQ
VKFFQTIRLHLIGLLLLLSATAQAQDRFTELERKLRELSATSPGLNEPVELSVNGVSIQEFIRGLAVSNSLNVIVDPELKIGIVNNFTNVTVTDVFVFLCKRYELDISFIGSIMSFGPYKLPPPPALQYVSKPIRLSYEKNTDQLSYDLTNDSLLLVAKELTKLTGKNVILVPELKGRMVSGFIQNMPVRSALEKLAFANDFKATATEEGVFLLEQKDKEDLSKKPGDRNKSYVLPQGMSLVVDPSGLLAIEAVNVPLTEIIGAVCKELKLNYFMFSELKGNATLTLKGSTFEEFLRYLLNGTEFTFKKEDGIYLFGDRNIEGLRATKVVQMRYRTVDKVADFIPAELKKGVDIKTFPDLNSFILSGSLPRISEIESFLRDIDKTVPVILIDVIIVDVKNTKTLETEIEAGLGASPYKQPANTPNVLYPAPNVTLGAQSINNLINGINGFGSINLGKVTPNFYLHLKALETQGYLKVRSTPQLATLNGHEATMSIGRTEYYLETQNTLIGAQNPALTSAQQWKQVAANLSVTINPIASGDDQVTLDITVKQSDFTARAAPTAPPGTESKDFKSLIRIRNDEMIILGGLEMNRVSDSGSGVPFLSRIPVLKWLFSSRTRADDKNKLTIFIKPTVLY